MQLVLVICTLRSCVDEDFSFCQSNYKQVVSDGAPSMVAVYGRIIYHYK